MADRLPRKLAAILYADVAGYSRLTGEDEDETHRTLSDYLNLISQNVLSHHGQVMHYAGDAVLAKFDSVMDAMTGAVAIQDELKARNADLSDDRKLQFRIGVNLGDVIEDRGDIYGEGVNVAARLETLADVGGICISDAVRTAIGTKLALNYEFMGEQQVKNIKSPLRAYQIKPQAEHSTQAIPEQIPELELPMEPSIAVLPFTNMSNDPEQEHFSDGITEDIITGLSRLSGLLVIARNSTMIYKGRAIDIKEVGREQGVRYVLEGSNRKSGNRIRVTAQLIDAKTGNHCWADRYDRDLDDIFAVQDEITRNVIVALQVALTEGEQARVFAGGTKNVEAWELVIRGKELMERHIKEDNIEAQRLLEKAVCLDPEYAAAWVYLGFTYAEDARWQWGDSPSESLEKAIEMGRKALEIDNKYPDSFSLLGFAYNLKGETEEAIDMVEKGVALAPNHAFVLAISAALLRFSDRTDDSIRQIKRAMRLSPIYPAWYLMVLGSAYSLKGDLEQAVVTLRQSVKREPESILPKPWLVNALVESNLTDEAGSVSKDILRIEPKFSRSVWAQAFGFTDPTKRGRLLENLEAAGLPS